MISITFVGDMSFADVLFCQGYGVRSTIKRYGADFLFEKVKQKISGADICFGNLETVLSRYEENDNSLGSVDMRGDPESATSLKNAGFTLVNVANNHMMQHGPEAFLETIQLLNANGIEQVGVKSADENWHSQPIIIDKGGMKIGFLGYSFELDLYHPRPLYCYGQDEPIIEDIKKLKCEVDFLVLSVHWGLENINRPSIITINRAHKFIDAGADAIIGHHPHVLQGIETYKGKFIAYSLGNFIFDMNWNDVFRESMILKLNIRDRNNFNFEISPTFNNTKYQPSPIGDAKSNEAFRHKFDNLSMLITQEIVGDLEKKSLAYYTEVDKEIRRNRYLSYLYFLKNLTRYKKKYFFHQVVRTIKSRFEDLKG